MPEDDERKAEQTDDDGDSDAGPRQVLEETPEAIERAGAAASEASDELKKEVRAKVDDAKAT